MYEGGFGKNFSSPTLLVDNDIVIFGGETDSSEGACSTNLPDKHEQKNLLKGLAKLLQPFKNLISPYTLL